MPRPMKGQAWLKRKSWKSSRLLIFLTPMEEDPLIPKVHFKSIRTQSRHDFPRLLIEKPNYLSNDRRPRCRRLRPNRLWIVLRTDDRTSVRQRYQRKHKKDLQFVWWWKDRVHLNKEPAAGGKRVRRDDWWILVARDDWEGRHRQRWTSFIRVVLQHHNEEDLCRLIYIIKHLRQHIYPANTIRLSVESFIKQDSGDKERWGYCL